MIDFEALDSIAKKLMAARKSHIEREVGAIYDHGRRVSDAVIALRARMTTDDSNDACLRVAGLFHDVGKGLEPHNRYGAAIVREALAGVLAQEELAQVERLILAHCDRQPARNVHDMPAKLLQDADLLDHFGSYSIWMCFHYYAHTDEGIAIAADYLKDESENREGKYLAMLNFEVSKDILRDKFAFMRAFSGRLSVEAAGGYFPISNAGGEL